MTKGATRTPRFRYGTVRRVAGGGVALDLIVEFTDLGAPEYAVTGVASIERISQGQVRITKYSRRKDGNFVTHHEIWDFEAWQRQLLSYEEAARLIARMGWSNGPTEEGRRGQREAH